jgi:PRC-barrel domain
MNTAEGGSPRDPIPAMAGAPCGRRRHRGSRVPGAVLHCALLASVLGPAPSVTASAAEGSAAAPPAAARARIPRGAALPLLGRDVRGPSGQVVAQIVNVLVDEAGRPLAAVLDYGGFMGVGKRRIAVAWEVLRFAPGEQDGTIALDLTRDQLKDFPEHKRGEPVVAAAPAPAAAPE